MSPMQQIFLGLGAVATKTYLDDIFSTYLYKGNNSTNTLNTGLDMSGEGGLVWLKARSSGRQHILFDTARGANKKLASNDNAAEWDGTGTYNQTFTSTGFTVNNTLTDVNDTNVTYSSWNFRKAKGFFDVVTFNETGSPHSDFTVSHSLGCIPGMIILKRTDGGSDWWVWHKYDPTGLLRLNTTAANTDMTNDWCIPTSTNFTFRPTYVGAMGAASWVAYLFAGGESTAATARCVEFDGAGGGSGAYLRTSASSDYTFGTGDFTVEFWIKPDNYTQQRIVVDQRDDSNDSSEFCLYIHTDGKLIFWRGGDIINTLQPLTLGSWSHVAFVRNSNTTTLYLNGFFQASVSDNTDYTANRLTFATYGSGLGTYMFDGNLSNIRVVKGTAVYTSSFRVPTEPLTNITNTKLLCCNNSSVTGTTTGTVTSSGTPTASTDSPFDDPAGFKFGEAGDSSVIKCGSYVGNGSSTGPEINLGWEPQYILVKNTGASEHWQTFDSMRGIVTGGNDEHIKPSSTDAGSSVEFLELTPTGFKIKTTGGEVNNNGDTIIYMAIRRSDGYVGKPAEAGTDVFTVVNSATDGVAPWMRTPNHLVDFEFFKDRTSTGNWTTSARLIQQELIYLNSNAAESAHSLQKFDFQDGFNSGTESSGNYTGWLWKRHAGMDVVTYKGDGVAGRQILHSLNKTVEMIWVKSRSANGWAVGHKGLDGGTNPWEHNLKLDENAAEESYTNRWNDTAPTSTHFTVGTSNRVNLSGDGYIAMLFASVDGISKVGSYAGSSSAVTVTLGFSPRLIILKNATSTNWWVLLDTVRGLATSSGGTSQGLYPAETNAQSAATYIHKTSTGFVLGTGSATYNASGSSYIYYAHA